MNKPSQVVGVFVTAINQVLEVTSFEFCFSMIGAELMSIPILLKSLYLQAGKFINAYILAGHESERF